MLTPVVLGEVALSAVLAHAGNEHLIILALIPTREKSKRRAPGSRDPALAWNTTARTSPVRTLGSRSGSLPGCVYAWLCTSATVEGLARARACWAAGQIGESAHPGQLGVRKGSATDTELGSDASGHRSAPGTRMRHRCSWQDRRRAGFGNTQLGSAGGSWPVAIVWAQATCHALRFQPMRRQVPTGSNPMAWCRPTLPSFGNVMPATAV